MPREIRIDRDVCMGSGHCSFYAPHTFAQDDAMVAVVLDPDGDTEQAVHLAVDCCPTQAITLAASPFDLDSQPTS